VDVLVLAPPLIVQGRAVKVHDYVAGVFGGPEQSAAVSTHHRSRYVKITGQLVSGGGKT
jgi:hypothetical protein